MEIFKNKKLMIIIGSVVASLAILISAFFIVSNVIEKKNFEKAANTVTEHIEKIDTSKITLDSENMLMSIKTEYDLLSAEQQKLVTNYSVLEKALAELQKLKDKEIAEELVYEISKINKDTLTADNTSVGILMEKYDALTDSQKELVTNYDLLLDYKKIIDKEIKAEKQKEAGIALAENFEGFSGKWGDFGAHKDEYQGMIEAALRKDVNYKKYFSVHVDKLDFEVSRFTKSESIFGIGICYFTFSGPDSLYKEYHGTLHGEIVIKGDGTLYATVNDYY